MWKKKAIEKNVFISFLLRKWSLDESRIWSIPPLWANQRAFLPDKRGNLVFMSHVGKIFWFHKTTTYTHSFSLSLFSLTHFQSLSNQILKSLFDLSLLINLPCDGTSWWTSVNSPDCRRKTHAVTQLEAFYSCDSLSVESLILKTKTSGGLFYFTVKYHQAYYSLVQQ